jgi:hypothetical protein
MTYAELLKLLLQMSKERLQDNVTIFFDDEFYGDVYLHNANDNGVLDDGHIYLSLEPFEDDSVIE